MFLSAFLFHGNTKIIFDLIIENRLRLYVSSELKNEVLNKMERYKATKQVKSDVRYFFRERSTIVEPKIKLDICRDPRDNFLLELAEAVKADYLITRDKDLLSLPNKRWRITKIITPEAFLPLLRIKKLIK
jgi:hypothetical protein